MSISSKNVAAIAFVLVALLFGIWVAGTFAAVRLAAKESAQRALLVEANQLLNDYLRQHDNYPDSLADLPLTYPDGGDASLLSEFKYESDGRSFTLTTVGASTGEELMLSSDGLAIE